MGREDDKRRGKERKTENKKSPFLSCTSWGEKRKAGGRSKHAGRRGSQQSSSAPRGGFDLARTQDESKRGTRRTGARGARNQKKKKERAPLLPPPLSRLPRIPGFFYAVRPGLDAALKKTVAMMMSFTRTFTVAFSLASKQIAVCAEERTYGRICTAWPPPALGDRFACGALIPAGWRSIWGGLNAFKTRYGSFTEPPSLSFSGLPMAILAGDRR